MKRSTLKVGDKVIFLGHDADYDDHKENPIPAIGEICTINSVYNDTTIDQLVTVDGYKEGMFGYRFELVKATPIEDIPEIDWTKPVQTIDGEKVEIISTKGSLPYPVLGYVEDSTILSEWTLEGKVVPGEQDDAKNLQNAPEKPKGVVKYINVYASNLGSYFGSCSFDSREEADKMAVGERLGVKRVVFTEGEWDE